MILRKNFNYCEWIFFKDRGVPPGHPNFLVMPLIHIDDYENFLKIMLNESTSNSKSKILFSFIQHFDDIQSCTFFVWLSFRSQMNDFTFLILSFFSFSWLNFYMHSCHNFWLKCSYDFFVRYFSLFLSYASYDNLYIGWMTW